MNAPNTLARIPSSLQHHVMALLLHDDQYCKTITQMIELNQWVADPVIVMFLAQVYTYVKQYGTAPKEHSVDLISQMTLSHESKDQLYQLLGYCRPQEMNYDYIMDCLAKFHRQMCLRGAVMEASKLIDDPNQLDRVEEILMDNINKRFASFDPGITLKDAIKQRMEDLTGDEERNFIRTGIPLFDTTGAMPQRKGLTLFMSVQKWGKSWWLAHMAKQAILEGKRVLHITLENSQDVTRDRYLQVFGAFIRQNSLSADGTATRFSYSLNGQFQAETWKPPVLEDIGEFCVWGGQFLESYLAEKLYIKYFPNNSLTVKGLEVYLDMMHMEYDFVPDVLIVDYPDLLKASGHGRDHRIEVGSRYVDLRGLIGERDMFGLAPSQVNKLAINASRIESHHVSEDMSKISTCDLVYSYHRTEDEDRLGLGRMYVVASRYSRMGQEALIFHHMPTGQFVRHSAEMNDTWKTEIKSLSKMEKDSIKSSDPQEA